MCPSLDHAARVSGSIGTDIWYTTYLLLFNGRISAGYKESRNANNASWSAGLSPPKRSRAFWASPPWRRIAFLMVFDPPSCMKRSRRDSPHNGAVRNSVPFGAALLNAVSKPCSHGVQQQV